MRSSISCVIIKAKPIDTVFFNTALSNTLRPCGLEFAEGIRPPFAKNRTSFTTSDASDAENRRPAALPYAGCTPYSTGIKTQPPQSSSHRTTQAPLFGPPGGPVCPVFTPGGGTTRPSPVRGRFGPHRAQFGRKKRKQPSPESSHQRRRRICQLLTSHQAHGFLKNQQWREV